MKSGILLALVWALSTAGCECPSMVEQPGGVGTTDYSHGDGWRWGALPPARPAPSKDSVTYLGAQVARVPEALRAQLSLPEDAGLMVTAVAPGSPAAAAKLARFDVLVRINRQYLINPEQLEVLVRDAKPGQEVRLTVVRQAKLASVMVRLGSRKVSEGEMDRGAPAHAMRGAPMGPGWGRPMREGGEGPNMPGMWGRPVSEDRDGRPMPGPWGPAMRGRANERAEGYEEGNESPKGGLHYRMQKGPDGKMEIIPVPPGREGPGNRPGPGARDDREGPYKGEMIFQAHEDGTMIQAFRDNEYALRLVTDAKGNKTLTARSVKDPKAVFEGPINTPQQRAKFPAPLQRRLEQMGGGSVLELPPPDKREK
jgi:hypothetical protein